MPNFFTSIQEKWYLLSFAFLGICISCSNNNSSVINIAQGTSITLIGNNLCSRMMLYGHFETEMQLRYPDSQLFIRNMCDGGNTPGFRPHAGRPLPWAYPGAEKYQTELAQNSGSEGTFETPDQWLTRLETDIIIAFFGFNESFAGMAGLENYKNELESFIKHTLSQKYNGTSPPQLVIVSPTAFQYISNEYELPDGKKENEQLEMYSKAMEEISQNYKVKFIDAFHTSQKWFTTKGDLTIDGAQLNDKGYQLFTTFLANSIFGEQSVEGKGDRSAVNQAVKEKNFFWHNDYKIPNGVHVFGRRYQPYGPENYPYEIQKSREMTLVRDTLIWATVNGLRFDLKAADEKTLKLPEINTNYNINNTASAGEYFYGEDALNTLKLPSGYQATLFASEKEFPELANPVQLSFDNQGRLWVATLPSYPHYKPGDPKPNDKLLILEDTNADGKADKQTIFAENLHLPTGFEFAPEGVYVSQGTDLKLYTDTNGDDKADKVETVLSGFDDHDTHHAISAFCADPSGAFYMSEGAFLHSNVETAYGPVRGTNGGFFRYNPKRKKLERTAQLTIINPWGVAFDEWGQDFFAQTSNPKVHWMMPGTLKPRYGVASPLSRELIEPAHQVRPTSGMEFIYSSHFPDEVQGDLLIGNTIGFLGIKQHQFTDEGTGYTTKHRQDLLVSDDQNFRPVDMEFAPDGSLYLVDWHNVLIGHMQHNARDPLRDHVHGRIYRITYPSRPLVKPAKVAGASIDELLNNLKLPEYRTRYRTRRELRGRDTEEVYKRLTAWQKQLDPKDAKYEHHLLEAIWVSWGINKVDKALLEKLLSAKDYHVRTAAVRVLRYTGHQIENQVELLANAAADEHGRVRLEAIVAASWLAQEEGEKILNEAEKHDLDSWINASFNFAKAQLSGEFTENVEDQIIASHLTGEDLQVFSKGKKIYETEGYCITCHQESGTGLQASGYPTLVAVDWVTGNEERLIKLALNGLYGPMYVMGNYYSGQVPMMAFGGILDDEEIAAVLTYVRNAFGNQASVISPETVKRVREETKDKKGFYTPEELKELHPN
ncbi:MAG: PVC-type heme-binding CxxCH protein [Bacteroidota bacterium]